MNDDELDQTPPVDEETLKLLRDSMGDDFAELVPVFLESTSEIIASLKQAYADQNIEDFTHHAHSLKSSSASLGGLGLAAMAKHLEHDARSGQLPESAEFIESMEQEFDRIGDVLKQFM